MKIHFLASLQHYADHIDAVWQHLPPSLRGSINVGRSPSDAAWPEDDVVMIGGFADIERVKRCRMVMVEHGSGQSYKGVPESRRGYYHGDEHDPRVIGYISPRRAVAESWGRPAYAAGAPICDPYPLFTTNERPKACFTFHWPGDLICPEAGTAFPHYAEHLPEIVDRLRSQGFDVYGHAHPRYPFLREAWERMGVEYVGHEEVRMNVDLLIADNTSLAYEMCYLLRSVIVLNCPQYRRNVEHGLRFWQWHGLEVDHPEQLLRFDFRWFVGDQRWMHGIEPQKNAIAAYDRGYSDGRDGQRAAAWLTSLAYVL